MPPRHTHKTYRAVTVELSSLAKAPIRRMMNCSKEQIGSSRTELHGLRTAADFCKVMGLAQAPNQKNK